MKAPLIALFCLLLISCEKQADSPQPITTDYSVVTTDWPPVKKLMNGCPEDVNLDGIVDVRDGQDIVSYYGQCDQCTSDVNSDGFVDDLDMDLVELAMGTVCPNPPAAFLSYFLPVESPHIQGDSVSGYFPPYLYSVVDQSFLQRDRVDSIRWYIDDVLVSFDPWSLKFYFPNAVDASQFVWAPSCTWTDLTIRCEQWVEEKCFGVSRCVSLRYDSHTNNSTGTVVFNCGVIVCQGFHDWEFYTY